MTPGFLRSRPEINLRIVALTIMMVVMPARVSSGRSIEEQERAIIVYIYDTFGGIGWTNADNWNSANPVGTWYGISTDEIGGATRITGIDLSNNNLIGVIVESSNQDRFFQVGAVLSELQVLNFNRNSLSGLMMHAQLGNFETLRYLGLAQNSLSGTIPVELTDLVLLHTLELSGNNLSGGIPSEIGLMTSLQSLNLDANSLSGSLPSELGNLVNLTFLSVASNQFTGPIPVKFGNLASLKILNLKDNELSGDIPVELVSLNLLSELELDENQLENLPNFSGHPSLTRLQVENNLLTFEDLEQNIGIPNFTYSPQGSFGDTATLNVTEGDPLNLTFVDGGTSNLYQWHLGASPIGASPIAGATSATYTKVAELTDAGEYTLSVTNAIVTGLGLTSAAITVNVAPAVVPNISATPLTFDFGNVGLDAPATTTINISNTGTAPGDVSFLIVSDSLFDFGDVPLGSATPTTITISNTDSLYHPLTFSIINDASGAFSQNAQDGTLQAGASLKIIVSFAPAARGVVSGTLRITSTSSSETLDVPLSGTGISPVINPDETSVDFDPTAIGSTSMQNVNITNSGELPLTFVTDIGGSDPGAFSVSPANGTVIPGLTATLQVSFSPSTLGLLNASLQISNNSPNTQVVIPLSGTGTGVEDVSASPSLFDFGDVPLGSHHLTTITISNTGTAPAPLTFSIINDASGAFSQNAQDGTLQAGASREIIVSFAPAARGVVSGTLRITSTSSSETLDVPLSGTGTSPLLELDVTSIDFGTLVIGQTEMNTVTISNAGELPLAFTTSLQGPDASEYSLSSAGGTVQAGSSTVLRVEFSPTSAGLLRSSIFINNDSPTKQLIIPLSGTGVEPPAIELSQSEMDALAAFYNGMNGDSWANNSNWLSDATPDTWFGLSVEEPAAGKSALVQVTGIELSSNNLVGEFPAEWATNIADGAFAGLRILRLSNNAISGEIFSGIGSLSSLEELALNGNNLSGAIPPSLVNLAGTLQELSLGGNSFSGPFPLELILALTNLEFVSLADLGLTGNVPDLSAHTSLKELHLENNAFSGPLPVWLSTLTNLKSLWLGNNQFSGSVPSEFGNLTQLQLLQLSENQFDGELPHALTSLVALHTLLMSSNGFNGLPDFSGTQSLTRLEVENNNLTFEDLEANASISTFVYAPQAEIGTASSETVTEGDDLGGILSLEVGGASNQYQWFRDNSAIEGANMPTYDSPAALSDAGDWILQVTNSTVPDLTLRSGAISLLVERAPLAISPAGVDFGDVNVGEFGTTTIQLINPGAASVDFGFSLVDNAENACCFSAWTASVVLDPFATINIEIGFTPVSHGPASAILHVESSNPVTSFDVSLSANGTSAVMELSSISFNFGTVVVGIGASETLTISNTGELPLNFDAALPAVAGPGFSVSPTSGSIPIGSNTTLTLTFSPTSEGVQTASIELTSNDPDSPLSVDLTGVGVNFGIIGPEPQTLSPETGSGLEITVELVPNATPDSGTLFYRRTGEFRYGQSPFVIGTTAASATIPTEFVTERGLEYYSVFVAGSLSASIPAVSEPSLFPVHLPVSVQLLEAQGAFIPDAYQMVSVPLLLQDPRIESVLSAFGPYDPVRWRILHWNPQAGVYDEFPNLPAGFTPCQAYWLITQQGQGFTVENGSSVSPTEPCDLVARPGWNQISIPYSFPIRWEEVGGSELLEPPVAYVPAVAQTDPYQYNQTVLQPWNGYWVNNRTDNDVPLVFSPIEAVGKRSKNGASTVDRALTFSVQLTASIAHLALVDSNNLVGFSALATDEYDQLDYAEAPPIGSFVRLSLMDGDQRLAGDFKPPSEEGKSWLLEIDADLGRRAMVEGEYIGVELEDQGQLPPNFDVYVFDEDLRERIPITENRFGVYLSRELAQRRLRLVIGTPAFARAAGGGIPLLPVQVALEQNFPNPFSGSTHIRYQIQETQEVVLQVFDLLGRLVTTLEKSEQTAGWYDIAWDGRDDSGANVASGMYVYKLRTGSTVQIRSMIRVK